ncbi:unnamed protein product [Symbiodinium sp. CCMP2592]|nr:unnamed protein product [Symbiodinium sp. CCMP2592]
MAGDSAPSVSLEGLAAEWDGIPTIRDRLRAGRAIIEEVSSKNVDIQTPSAFSDVLVPILVRMRECAKQLPSIEAVREQVASLLEMNKRDPDETVVHKNSWLLKKQCVFVKMKVRRMEAVVDQVNESRAKLLALRSSRQSEDSFDEDDYDDDGSDLAGLLEQMRELNENNSVDPRSSGSGGEAGELSTQLDVVSVDDDAANDNDEANYESAEDAIRAIDYEEPCEDRASKLARLALIKAKLQQRHSCIQGLPMVTKAATDSQETIPTNIMEVPSPPSASKPVLSPDRSAEEQREQFQRRQAKTATKIMGDDDDDEFPCSPRSPYNPYPASPSHPKARSSKDDFTPDGKVSEHKCDRAAQLGLRQQTKQGRGRGGRGRGRGRGHKKAAEFSAAEWAEWEEWDRLETEWNETGLEEVDNDAEAAENEPIVEKSNKKKKKNEAEAAEDEQTIVEKSKKKNKAEAAEEEQPIVEKPKKKKNSAKAAEEEQPIVEKPKKNKKKNSAEAAEKESIVEKSKKKKNSAKAADEAPIVEKSKKKKKAEAADEVPESANKRRRGGNGDTDGEKASFAGRYRANKRPFEGARWDAIKEAFETYVKPKGPFWTWCMKDMKDQDVTIENVSEYVAKSTKRYLKLALAL